MERSRRMMASYRAGKAGLDDVYRTICQEGVETLGATRIGIWLFNEIGDAITNVCTLDARTGEERGVVLEEDDFPAYFRSIRDNLRVVATDAATHPATAAFDETYFAPLDIMSLLDVVVFIASSPAAVICAEHCGERREWSEADILYLEQLAVVIRMLLKIPVNRAA